MSRPVVFAQAAAVVVAYFIGLTLVYMWFIELNALPRPSFSSLFLAVTSVAVLSNIPIAVNGLGVRERLHAWLLAPLGIPAEIAVAISLLLYGHLLVGSPLRPDGVAAGTRTPGRHRGAGGDVVEGRQATGDGQRAKLADAVSSGAGPRPRGWSRP